MKRILRFLAACLVLAMACCQAPSQSEPAERRPIRGERIAAHAKFLSSDLLEGRGVASRGEALATEYIATQFALAGARPAGDGGAYFQHVPLVGVESLPATSLAWRDGGERTPMSYLQDFVALNHRQHPEVEIDAETVYVGHGIYAPEFAWDDYKGIDLSGKIALLFTNEPPSDDPDFFGGKALTYYGRWTFKYEEALRRGALGVLIIHTTPTAGYPWQVVRNSWGRRNPFVKLQPDEPALALAGWITSAAAEKILATTGKSLEELLAAAEQRDFQPIPLGLRLQGRIVSQITPMDTRNVVAIVEGSDPRRKQEAVVYTAHWDHLGIGIEVNGDSIYNGAVDNATGCGILLDTARAFAELPVKPARSVIFAAVGAEEGGLRGSEFYAHHPLIPPGKTALNLNYDGLLPLGPVRDVSLPGYERTTLRALVEQTARQFGLTIRPEAQPEQGYYYRSDHFSLAKVGVPAFSLSLGVDYVGKPEGWGKKAREDYTAQHYHQPSDEFDPQWDFSGLDQLANLGFELGRSVATRPELPNWLPGDEFLPAREKSWGR